MVIPAERHVFDGRDELMIIAPDGIAPGENIGFAIDYSGLLARSVLGPGATIVASSWAPQLVYTDNIKVSDTISPSGSMAIIVLSGCTVYNTYHWINTIKLSTGEIYVRTLVVDGVPK
ncbi:MAG: hypothetical protein F8N15_00450 [Methanobacterium sp.]|nr:hypothetical protein [Methanobacterium sp.]